MSEPFEHHLNALKRIIEDTRKRNRELNEMRFEQEKDIAGLTSERDSLRAELAALKQTEPTLWKAPASLPDGEYKWDGVVLAKGTAAYHNTHIGFPDVYRPYKDWTYPPRVGKWLVKDGVGTWQGE